MDDRLKSLRALARGKHDDFSVAYDAIDTITNFKTIIFDLLNMPDFDGTEAVSEARRATKRAARAAISDI